MLPRAGLTRGMMTPCEPSSISPKLRSKHSRAFVGEKVFASDDAAEEKVCRRFLESFRVLPASKAVAERAVRLRRTHRLKLPDTIIWASAQEKACLLVTRNTKDFPADDAGGRFPYMG